MLKNTSLPTLHPNNFTRDVPKGTSTDERYATNILPSAQPLSMSIRKTDTVAGYNNVS